ncbi:hypothetical protein [Flagellimonas lutimaris]|uniref:hypothetical protein n=1 Tax=Flagellimonas lutimaris TaxID=475082 RepID=UPI0039C20273
MFVFLFMTLVFSSCNKDEDLFAEAIQESIDEEVTDQIDPNNQDNSDDNTSTGNTVEDSTVSTDLKAFPTAYGAGAYTTGGRGGKILNVTTTEDTGAEGSLRWAISQQGPRIVVFKVGGVFELTRGRLKLGPLNNDLTIAGQTAPGDGVTISGDYLQMSNVDNVIMRYIRFRGVQNGSYQADIITGIDCTNIIIDHCSANWGRDEIWSFTSSRTIMGQVTTGNITIQRSILAEMDPDHSTASLFGTISEEYKANSGDFSWNQNYAYNISHRFPNTLGTGKFEIKNNVVYNWAYRLTSSYYGAEVNQQNNYYKMGPRTLRNANGNEGGDLYAVFNRVGNNGTEPSIYAKGNIVPGVIDDVNADNFVMWRWFLNSEGKSRQSVVPRTIEKSSVPQPLGSALPMLSAVDAYNSVLSDVGANKSLKEDGSYKFNLDQLDSEYVAAALNDSGESRYRDVSEWILPNYSNPNNNQPYLDSDNDGMPNTWEIAMGLNPELDDSAGDLDDDGYTNIEEFINLVDF